MVMSQPQKYLWIIAANYWGYAIFMHLFDALVIENAKELAVVESSNVRGLSSDEL
jgi:hypothetical protein